MSTPIDYQIENERRRIAAEMGFMTEDMFASLAKATPGTVEGRRKLSKGPSHILLGNAYFYEVSDVMAYMKSLKNDCKPYGKRTAK